MHLYPPSVKFEQRQRISFNFQWRYQVLRNTDTRYFEIQTSNMGFPPPPLAGPQYWV